MLITAVVRSRTPQVGSRGARAQRIAPSTIDRRTLTSKIYLIDQQPSGELTPSQHRTGAVAGNLNAIEEGADIPLAGPTLTEKGHRIDRHRGGHPQKVKPGAAQQHRPIAPLRH